MKTLQQILPAAAVLLWATTTHAAMDGVSYSGTTTVNQMIPDGDPAGLASTVNVSIGGNPIIDGTLSVSLNISGSYSGDLYAYLSHAGEICVLLNRVGTSPTDRLGYGDAGMNVTFSDSAANGNIHYYQNVTTPAAGTPLTGVWAPDGRTVNPYTVNGTETPTALLSSFSGIDPNGAWTLFVADLNGGDLHQLNSWGMQFTAVPEPGYSAIFAGLGGLGLLLYRKILSR